MPTFTQIGTAQVVGAGGSATIDFNTIPGTYTDLILKVSARTTFATNGDLGYVRFNGSASTYSVKRLAGDGSSAFSSGGSEIYFRNDGASDTASTFGNVDIYIPNYASSTQKSVSLDSVNENNATLAYTQLSAGLWTGTAAITQVTLYPNNGVWAQYSTAYLYGVSNA